MKNDKVLSLMGLAKKAGKLKSGEFCVETELKKGKAKLVIVAGDASDNTKKNYNDMCSYRRVPIVLYSDKESLGKCLGTDERAAAVIIDEGFSNGILKEFGNQSEVVE